MKNCLRVALMLALAGIGIQANAAVVYDKDGQLLNIFGRAQAGFLNSAARSIDEDGTHKKGGIVSDVRLGIIGKSTLSTNVNALAHVEWDLNSWEQEGEHLKTRYAYTGVDFGPYGVITIGQQDAATYQTIGFTDVFERWGGEGSSYWDLGGRQEGQLALVNAIGGYAIAATLQTKISNAGRLFNHDTGRYYNAQVKHGFATALSYNWEREQLKDLAFSISYDYYKLDNQADGIRGKRSFNTALSYGKLDSGIYTSLLYSKTKFAGEAHHLTGVEAVLGYTFDNGLGLLSGYAYSGYDLHLTHSANINTQVSYDFSEGFRAYAEGRFGLKKKEFALEDREQRTLWTLGVQYSF